MMNAYNWWQIALTGEKLGGPNLPVYEDYPQCGFYRKRKFKNGPWQAVAIFEHEGRIIATVDDDVVDASDVWTFVCKNPVSYEAYQDFRAGKGWPDEDQALAKVLLPPTPSIGDNSGAVDEAETLKDQIDAALKGTSAYAKITDDATAAKALSLRNRLNELSGQADKIRVKEKEPHLEAGKAIDARWQPLVKKAKAGADEVKAAIAAWETEKLRKQRELERQQAEALRKQEESARVDEHAGAAPEPKAETPQPPASAPTPIKPTYGKAASVSVKTVVKEVTDWAALAVYMSNHPDCQDLLRNLAQRALDAGRTNIPGVVTDEEAKVK